MIGIIVITHGDLSSELVKTAEMIMGKQENIETITFTVKESLDTLRQSAKAAVDKFAAEDGSLILTDIMGGSATNVCAELIKNDKVEVVTGVNLPMIIEAAAQRNMLNLKELAAKIEQSGSKSIINFKEFFAKRASGKK
jgi:mannose/fructose/sorbose-specific phosphotransferase system IIA component